MLTTSQLSIFAHDKCLLNDVSITLKPATLYALIGHNGSGKSTLIKALAGETKPTQGAISLDGQDLSRFSPKTLAKQLAYLPQKLPDQAGFTVAELVMLGRFAYQSWLGKPSDQDNTIVQDAMMLTDTQQFAQRPLTDLSGGEKARAWLAMCLAQRAKYLLLDEPLAPLDVVYQVQMLRLIQRLAHEFGLCVLVIVHDINLVAGFFDEVIALKGGRLCYVGSADTLMTAEALADIFGVDFKLLTHPISHKKVAVV